MPLNLHSSAPSLSLPLCLSHRLFSGKFFNRNGSHRRDGERRMKFMKALYNSIMYIYIYIHRLLRRHYVDIHVTFIHSLLVLLWDFSSTISSFFRPKKEGQLVSSVLSIIISTRKVDGWKMQRGGEAILNHGPVVENWISSSGLFVGNVWISPDYFFGGGEKNWIEWIEDRS